VLAAGEATGALGAGAAEDVVIARAAETNARACLAHDVVVTKSERDTARAVPRKVVVSYPRFSSSQKSASSV